jgi:integrase
MRVKLTTQFIDAIKPPELGQVDYWDTKVTGLGLRVSQGGKKTWNVWYRNDAHPKGCRLTLKGVYPVIGLADARSLAAAPLREAEHGSDPANAKQAAREADSFAELAALYLERHAKVEKRSWREDDRILEHDLLAVWKNRKAADIKRKDAIALLDGIVERGALVQANRVKALISKVFNFGIRRGVVEANPAYGIGAPGGKEQKRDRVLSEDEIRRVWAALDAEPPKVANVFRLAFLTMQRKSEITGMRWDEVDLDGACWTIGAERSKNKLSHRVPFGPQAVAILRAMKADAKEGARDVFPGRRHNGLALAYLGKAVERVRAASGVDFRFHDIRRTGASLATGLGISRLVVSKILNHVENGITAVYDRHSYDAEKRGALLKWDRHVERLLTATPAASNVVELRA